MTTTYRPRLVGPATTPPPHVVVWDPTTWNEIFEGNPGDLRLTPGVYPASDGTDNAFALVVDESFVSYRYGEGPNN